MQKNSFISSFKLIIKLALFIALLVPVYNVLCDRYADAKERNIRNVWNDWRFEHFYDLEPDTLDLVFVGSSHSYCTFDPAMFDDGLGIVSYQMGMPQQRPDGTYFTLREIFNYQRPSLVIMELYWDMLTPAFDPNQAEQLFLALKNEELKEEFIRETYPWNERIKHNIPVVRYQLDYFRHKNRDFAEDFEERFGVYVVKNNDERTGREGYGGKGYISSTYVIEQAKLGRGNQFNGFDGKRWEFDTALRKYLEQITELCRKNGAELVFVTAPVAPVSFEKISNYHAIHDTLADFAAANGVLYYDYHTESLDSFADESFRDDAHLNDSGAEIAGWLLMEWLKECGLL